MGQVQTYGPGGGILSQHDVDGKILHGRVQHLLNLTVQTVYLVHEKHISFLEIVQYGRHLSRLFNGRAAGHLHIGSHLIGNDTCQRGLAQSRRAVKQHMVQSLPSGLGCFYIDVKGGLNLLLPYIIPETLGSERGLYALVLRRYFRCYNPAFHLHLCISQFHLCQNPYRKDRCFKDAFNTSSEVIPSVTSTCFTALDASVLV